MVLVKATAASERGDAPSLDLLEAMGMFNEALEAAGVLESAGGLKPSRDGKRVVFEP